MKFLHIYLPIHGCRAVIGRVSLVLQRGSYFGSTNERSDHTAAVAAHPASWTARAVRAAAHSRMDGASSTTRAGV